MCICLEKPKVIDHSIFKGKHPSFLPIVNSNYTFKGHIVLPHSKITLNV